MGRSAAMPTGPLSPTGAVRKAKTWNVPHRCFMKNETNITRLALWAAIGFLVIAVALAIYQVTTRFAFGRPSTWSEVIHALGDDLVGVPRRRPRLSAKAR